MSRLHLSPRRLRQPLRDRGEDGVERGPRRAEDGGLAAVGLCEDAVGGVEGEEGLGLFEEVGVVLDLCARA